MKTKDFITENLAMAAQEAQSDHEVNMARAQCYNAAQYAVEIHKLLKNISEIQGIEGWVASKLTLAEDYLNTVRDYLRYEAAKSNELEQFSPESATATLDSVLGEDSYDDAVSSFLGKNKPTQLPYKQPRKSEKTDFGSKHIAGRGEAGQGKGTRLGKGAKSTPVGKPVVTAETATGGATGSAAIASTPGTGKGKKVGSLFGGSYKQAKK